MEIAEEAFTRLNTAQWRALPVLNARELDEDAVKRPANAFDKYANVGFGGPPSSLGGTEEVIIAKSSISPRQGLHDNEEVADALHSKTRNFDQTRHYTLALWLFSRHTHPNFAKYL